MKKETQSDKDKVADGAARRGEERANGPRDATRATPSTRKAAEEGASKARDGNAKSPPGEGAGVRTGDPGGSDIRSGG